jgi:hypothetical protein
MNLTHSQCSGCVMYVNGVHYQRYPNRRSPVVRLQNINAKVEGMRLKVGLTANHAVDEAL